MNMQMVARGWLVYDLTSSEMALTWVMMSFMVPQVIFSLWGGVLADRHRKRSILVFAQGLNCIATIAMAIIILTGRITFWDFIWFGAFNGTVLALSIPGRNAFVPELVKQHQIITAMALNTTGMNFARIVAPAFAGILIAVLAAGNTTSTFGVGVVYVVIAVLYFISAATMFLVSKTGKPHPNPDRGSPLEEIRAGVSYVMNHGPVLALILLSIIPFLFGMTLNTLLPAFNEDVLGGGSEDLGFLMSATGGGAIIGSLMLASAGDLPRKGLWVVSTAVLWAMATIGFGLAASVWVAMLAIAAVGWLSSWNMSLNRGVMQLAAEPRMRGRVMSIDMMSHGLMPLGIIPMSLIAERYDVSVAIVVSGIVFLVATLILIGVSRPVRELDRDLAAHAAATT